MRARLLQVLAVLVVAAVCGVGGWWAFRNPVADLTPRASFGSPAGRARDGSEGPQTVRRGDVERPPPPPQGFVGSAACAECHPDISKQYHDHPMGRSLAGVLEAEPIEDYAENAGFRAPPSTHFDVTLRYYVERTAEGVWHHEQAVGPRDEVIYDQAVPVHYAVGSGQRGRSYITNRDGILLMSPMTWYSGKDRWDFSPGYDVNNMRFERRILEGCLTCHAGWVNPVEGQTNRFASDPFHEAVIGCERCHGPGEGHIAFQSGLADTAADPIVNPAELEAARRDAVCFQCHLVGARRIPRYGRGHFDFRPGDQLTDIWTVFVRGTGVEDDQTTKAVSQSEQMLSSVCYRASGGRLGCSTCHPAHSIPEPQTRVTFYRSRCLECHGSEEHTGCGLPEPERLAVTAEDSCIQCHMPRIEANDVPHTSQTDHRILRFPETDEAGGRGGQSVLKAFRAEDGPIPQAELDRARGLLLFIQAERRDNSVLAAQAIPLLEDWLERAPDDQRVAEALGGAHYMNKDVTAAFAAWDRGLALNPDNEDILRRVVAAYHEMGELEEGIRHARRLVRLNSWYHDYHGRLAHMLGQQGRFQEGIPAALRAVELNPAATGIHGWLSEVYGIVGQPEKARKHRRLYEKLKPRDRP